MRSHLSSVLEETTSTENDFSDQSSVVPRVFRFSFLFFFFFVNGVMFNNSMCGLGRSFSFYHSLCFVILEDHQEFSFDLNDQRVNRSLDYKTRF